MGITMIQSIRQLRDYAPLSLLDAKAVIIHITTTDNGNARLLIQQQFDKLIADVSAGQYATLTLADDENKATTRNLLKGAAERRGLTITFRRTRGETIIFHLEEPEKGKAS